MIRLLLSVCFLHLCFWKYVTGTVMTITPATVTLNAETSVNQTLRCSLTPTEQSTPVDSILFIKINRYGVNVQDSLYAKLTSSKPAELGSAQALSRLGATVSGRMENQNDAELVLAWSSSLVQCQDAGEYECEVGYLDSSFKTGNWKINNILSVQTISLNMVVSRGGLPVSPSQATMANPMEMPVGQTVTIECTADVGSQSTRIDFEHTRPFADTNDFQDFSPGPEDQYTEGQATPIDCAFRRVTTLHHNITQLDVQRNNLLAFRCGITYTEYNVQKTKRSEEVFFRADNEMQTRSSSASPATKTDSACGAIIGAAVGGYVAWVVVVAVAVAVWIRRGYSLKGHDRTADVITPTSNDAQPYETLNATENTQCYEQLYGIRTSDPQHAYYNTGVASYETLQTNRQDSTSNYDQLNCYEHQKKAYENLKVSAM